MFEIWGTYSTENATRGIAGWSLAAALSVPCTLVSLFTRVSPCLWKHGYANSLCMRPYESSSLYGGGKNNVACSSKSYNPAVFFLQDMDVYCTHRHKDTTCGKLHKFSLSFLHIYYWYTSNHLPPSPALQMQHKRVIQFPFLYYCYYW